MKKILPLALAMLMMSAGTNVVFADETVETGDKSATIALTASKDSSYSVKLPKKVDVSNTETTFNVYAKGDIKANQSLTVKVTDGTYALKDSTSGSSKTSALTISVDGGTFAYADLSTTDYKTDDYATFTVTHPALFAGVYSCELPITISLD